MPKEALTDTACREAKPTDKNYRLWDRDGLYLEIMKNGSKLWRVKFYNPKETRLSLGKYPVVTLKEARNRVFELRRQLSQGINPSEARRKEKSDKRAASENTFKAIALEWFEKREKTWSENYKSKVKRGLELNVFPYIGNRPIKDITPAIILEDCLRRIEKRGSLDIAGRTKQIVGLVFDYAISTSKCEWNAARNLKNALTPHQPEHFRSIDVKQYPLIARALERNEARLMERTRRAVAISFYTFLRPCEVRTARWAHIDFEAALWTIPADVMKKRKDHIIPLSKQVLLLLEAQKRETYDQDPNFVFPSQSKRGKPMSDGTVNKAIQRLGFGSAMVAHGVRAFARTTIREKLKYDSEVIERQLSHGPTGPLRGAYDRTQFLDIRKTMMQDWADFLDRVKNGSEKTLSIVEAA